MPKDAQTLRLDAQAIWLAGLESVRADRLVRQAVEVRSGSLLVADEAIDLATVGKITVVGAGKAAAGMAVGLEEALGPCVAAGKHLTGWVQVPADCLRPLDHIHLHPARPAGSNFPTPEGVAGSKQIQKLVTSLAADDLCVVLVSGGGSALLPLPIEGITLADKLALTHFLSDAGATIDELNTVRKQLSAIKGGHLARWCTARRMIVLVISDVPGDPLDVIASGPTVADTSTADDALAVLAKYRAADAGISPAVFAALEKRRGVQPEPIRCQASHVIVGNNAMAVDAAGLEAERRGYSHAMTCSTKPEGPAEDVGRHLAEMALAMRAKAGPDCLIAGGEPTVRLVAPDRRGLGGRNQQLVLAAAERLQAAGNHGGIVILSGGTDGEDGPTDAAGAWVDAQLIADAQQRKLDPAEYLARNDAYHWFEPLGGLIKTGPTHTNVSDLRVVVVNRA